MLLDDSYTRFDYSSQNDDNAVDNFFPNWQPDSTATPPDPGDGNSFVDTNEKYFKFIGAWYDDDRNPVTNPITGDRVYIDNSAPISSLEMR